MWTIINLGLIFLSFSLQFLASTFYNQSVKALMRHIPFTSNMAAFLALENNVCVLWFYLIGCFSWNSGVAVLHSLTAVKGLFPICVEKDDLNSWDKKQLKLRLKKYKVKINYSYFFLKQFFTKLNLLNSIKICLVLF